MRKTNLIAEYFLVFIFLFRPGAHAETIDGPANVRDRPGGRVIFSLDDGAYADCINYSEDWLRIKVSVAKKERLREKAIKKGSPLYGKDGTMIGKALANLKVLRGGEIEGYTHRVNIKEDFRAKDVLEKIFAANEKELSLSEFKKHIKEFRHVRRVEDKQYDSYFLYDASKGMGPGGASAIVIFHDGRLSALIMRDDLNPNVHRE